jgi:hypothetical protein
MSEMRDKIIAYAEKMEKTGQELHLMAMKLDEKTRDLHAAYMTLKALADQVDKNK